MLTGICVHIYIDIRTSIKWHKYTCIVGCYVYDCMPCMYSRVHMYIYWNTHVHIAYTSICLQTHTSLHICVDIHAYLLTYMEYIYVAYIHIYIYICVRMRARVCVCVNTYTDAGGRCTTGRECRNKSVIFCSSSITWIWGCYRCVSLVLSLCISHAWSLHLSLYLSFFFVCQTARILFII